MEKIGLLISKLQHWWRGQKENVLVNKTLRQYRCVAIMERAVAKLYALEVFRQMYCDRDRVGVEYCYYQHAYDKHLATLKETMNRCLSELEAYHPAKCDENEQE